MKLYKFRPLADCKDLERIEDIVSNGFYCCDFLNFNDMNEGVFSINSCNINIALSQKQEYKICSFSKKDALKSQLMWGHYANTGMGIVIEVEVNNSQYTKKVIYNNKHNELNSIEEILTHKTTSWEYEHEFRYISKNGNNKVFKDKITKIYFGTPYEQLVNYDSIKEQHKKLKKYLDLKKKLKYIIKIDYEDFKLT